MPSQSILTSVGRGGVALAWSPLPSPPPLRARRSRQVRRLRQVLRPAEWPTAACQDARRNPGGSGIAAATRCRECAAAAAADLGHLVDRPLERPVARPLLFVLLLQPDEVDIDLVGHAAAGEGDRLAVGRPDGRELVVGVPREVERRPRAVERRDPDVAVEVAVAVGIDEPLAVGRPVVLRRAPRGAEIAWRRCRPWPSSTGRRGRGCRPAGRRRG